MSTPSSIIRSAQSARKKRRAYEDAVAAFEYDLSSKTRDDYERYVAHLNKRAESTNDASEILSYQKKAYSAQSTYISNAIQVESMRIMVGEQTAQGKYNNMVDLYQQALASGDNDLAMNIQSQLYTLDIAIQREAAAANEAAASLADARVANVEELERILLNEPDSLDKNGLIGTAWMTKILEEEGLDGINTIAETTGGVGMWDIAIDVVRELERHYEVAMKAAATVGDRTEYNRFRDKFESIQNQTFKLNFGGSEFTVADIYLGANTAASGQDLFIPTVDTERSTSEKKVYTLKKTKIVDNVWAVNQDGSYQLIDTRDRVGDDYEAVLVDSEGNPFRDEQGREMNTKELMSVLGFDYVTESDGQAIFRANTNAQFDIPGVTAGDEINVVIGSAGLPRFVNNEGRIFDFQFSGGIKDVNPVSSVIQEASRIRHNFERQVLGLDKKPAMPKGLTNLQKQSWNLVQKEGLRKAETRIAPLTLQPQVRSNLLQQRKKQVARGPAVPLFYAPEVRDRIMERAGVLPQQQQQKFQPAPTTNNNLNQDPTKDTLIQTPWGN